MNNKGDTNDNIFASTSKKDSKDFWIDEGEEPSDNFEWHDDIVFDHKNADEQQPKILPTIPTLEQLDQYMDDDSIAPNPTSMPTSIPTTSASASHIHEERFTTMDLIFVIIFITSASVAFILHYYRRTPLTKSTQTTQTTQSTQSTQSTQNAATTKFEKAIQATQQFAKTNRGFVTSNISYVVLVVTITYFVYRKIACSVYKQ